MRPYHPFYGFQAIGLDGNHACHERVEIMASHYISEMRAVQPTGPYLIGGYSFGGLVAYEMAQQLLSCGEKVALLALIDTHPQQLNPVSSSFFGIFSPARAHILPRIPRMATRAIQRRARSLLLSPVLRDVLRSCHEAADHYNILPYPHKAVFFRANELSIRAIEDPDLSWTNLVGELEVHEIAGDHGGILVEPQVGALAAALKVCIDRVVPTLGDASPVRATVS
jgi:thioesterase domain-containing protein